MDTRKQGGWTMWSLLFSLSVVGFAAWIALKLVPVYMDNSTIRSVLKPLVQDRSLSDASYDEIFEIIDKRLDVNSVRWVKEEDVKFVEEDGFTQVRIDYEKRIKLMSNIELLVTFENYVNLPN